MTPEQNEAWVAALEECMAESRREWKARDVVDVERARADRLSEEITQWREVTGQFDPQALRSYLAGHSIPEADATHGRVLAAALERVRVLELATGPGHSCLMLAQHLNKAQAEVARLQALLKEHTR